MLSLFPHLAMHRRFAAFLAITLVAMTAQAQDPLKEIPGDKPPAFRALLPAEQYLQRQKKALAALGDVAALARSNLPGTGILVVEVAPGTQADSLGLKAGDIIFRINDKPVRWEDFPRSEDSVQTLHYYQATSSSLQTAEVRPGRIGFEHVPHWRPELLYLGSALRDPKWEAHVLVGITQRTEDPDLAETAWQQAIAAGYPLNFLAAQCGAEIALRQNRPVDAWKLASAALHARKTPEEVISPRVIHRAALANYQLAALSSFVAREPGSFRFKPDVLQRLVDLHTSRDEGERTLPPPSKLAAKRYRDNLAPRVAAFGQETYKRVDLHNLRSGSPVVLDAQTDHFHLFAVQTQEVVRDAEFRARFRLKTFDDQEGEYSKYVHFGIAATPADDDEEDYSGEHPLTLLRLAIYGRGVVEVRHSEVDAPLKFEAPELKLDGKQVHDFQLVMVAGRGEVFLDGTRLAYVPLPNKPRKLIFSMKAVGMRLRMDDTRIAELIEKAAAEVRLKVMVPHNKATLSLEGKEVKGQGQERTLTLAPATEGKSTVMLKVVWDQNGYTKISRVRKIEVEPGKSYEVDLRTRDEKTDPKDDIVVIYVPTPDDVVDKMAELAGIGKDDVVFDLGCGDGRMVCRAVAKYHAKRGVGIDIDPERVKDSQSTAKGYKVLDRVAFRQGDVLKPIKDLSEATVVMLYMGDDIGERLSPILRATLKPSSRVVSHQFSLGDWKPDKSITVQDGDMIDYELHLWVVKEEKKSEKK